MSFAFMVQHFIYEQQDPAGMWITIPELHQGLYWTCCEWNSERSEGHRGSVSLRQTPYPNRQKLKPPRFTSLKCFNVKTLSLLPLFGDTLDNPLIILEYIKIGGKKFSNASVTYLLPRHWPVSPDHFQIKCERLKGRKVESTQKKSVN